MALFVCVCVCMCTNTRTLTGREKIIHLDHLFKNINPIHPVRGYTVSTATEMVMTWNFHRWKVAQINNLVSDYRWVQALKMPSGCKWFCNRKKTTRSLDNLFAVKNWSYILLLWRTSDTKELCHPKNEKCLHHTASAKTRSCLPQSSRSECWDAVFVRESLGCITNTRLKWMTNFSLSEKNKRDTNTLLKTFSINRVSILCTKQPHHKKAEDDYFLSSSTKVQLQLPFTLQIHILH